MAGAAIGAGLAAVNEWWHCNKEDKVCVKRTMIVNVDNPNDSYIPVKLKKKGGEYIGPKGEHYKQLPTPEQLRPLYALPLSLPEPNQSTPLPAATEPNSCSKK